MIIEGKRNSIDPEANERAIQLQKRVAQRQNGDGRFKIAEDPQAVARLNRVLFELQKTQVANTARSVIWLTGRRPTINQLVSTSGISGKSVTEVLAREGLLVSPLPRVKVGEIPENEDYFYRGFSFGNYNVNRIIWSQHPYIVVSTYSLDTSKQSMLKAVFGHLGEIRQFNSGEEVKEERMTTKAYLNSPGFDFLLGRGLPGSRILLSKQRYGPFFLGLLAATLTEKKGRISLGSRWKDMLENAFNNFERHFGYSLGRFSNEKRPGGNLSVITVNNREAVVKSLGEVDSVGNLSFDKEVRQLLVHGS